jgi:hypothetical protein
VKAQKLQGHLSEQLSQIEALSNENAAKLRGAELDRYDATMGSDDSANESPKITVIKRKRQSFSLLLRAQEKAPSAELWCDLSAFSRHPKLAQDGRDREIRPTFMKYGVLSNDTGGAIGEWLDLGGIEIDGTIARASQ